MAKWIKSEKVVKKKKKRGDRETKAKKGEKRAERKIVYDT